MSASVRGPATIAGGKAFGAIGSGCGRPTEHAGQQSGMCVLHMGDGSRSESKSASELAQSLQALTLRQ